MFLEMSLNFTALSRCELYWEELSFDIIFLESDHVLEQSSDGFWVGHNVILTIAQEALSLLQESKSFFNFA